MSVCLHPFKGTGSDGERYTVDVVLNDKTGMVALCAGLEAVERRADGTFVIVRTGVVLTPETPSETYESLPP
jgi:hypothetical protein